MCDACWAAITIFTPPLCDVCGDPLPSLRVDQIECRTCPRCRRVEHVVRCSRAIGAYDGTLRAIIHALKYERRRSLARPLGRLLAVRGVAALSGADATVPVPLHRSRKRARGFNQAAEIARHLALPSLDILKRTRPTVSQTDLPAHERHANVKGAFALRSRADVNGLVVGTGGRCEHHRRDAGGVRPDARRGRRAGGSRRYRRASRRSTAVTTSADTTSRGRSPSRTQPGVARRLASVALTNACQEAEIALVPIAALRLPLHRCFRRNIEQNRQVRFRQKSLHVVQPAGIEPLRFAVGDAGGHVSIADHHTTVFEQPSHLDPPLVTVGHVQQLHHVGAVLAFAMKSPGDFSADSGGVVGK